MKEEIESIEEKLNYNSNKSIPDLGKINSKEIYSEIEKLDIKIVELNTEIINSIYDSFFKLYSPFLDLLEKKVDNDNIYEEINKTLLFQKDNKYISKTSRVIAIGIRDKIKSIKEIISTLPLKTTRTYLDEELEIKEEDSNNLKKQKKRLTRWTKKPSVKIKIQSIAKYHYENSYLAMLKEGLNMVGNTIYTTNNIINEWLFNLDYIENEYDIKKSIKNLSDKIKNNINNEKNNALLTFNKFARKYCNSILLDANKLEIKDIVILREEERTTKSLINIYQNISNYPIIFKNNTQYLFNHIELNFDLLKLKKTIIPRLDSLNKNIIDNKISPLINITENIILNIENLEADKLSNIEGEILDLGVDFNSEGFITKLNIDIENNANKICKQINIIPINMLDIFKQNQYNITPNKIDVPKISEYLIESEVLSNISKLLKTTLIDFKTEELKIENNIKLLNFSYSNQKEDNSFVDNVKKKVEQELSQTLITLKKIEQYYNKEIKHIKQLINKTLRDEIILKKANDFNGIIKKNKTQKGYYKYTENINRFIEKLDNNIDKLIIKGKDLLAISSYEYRTKELQNPHSKIGEFVEAISMSESISKKIPFYYQQLFTGKHKAPNVPLENRKKEIKLFKNAINRYNKEKKGGAIMFTGEYYSGMSYLIENLIKITNFDKVIKIEKPLTTINKYEELIDKAFKDASGLNLPINEIINKIPKNSVIIIEDIELWWTRTEEGLNNALYLNNLIKKYSHKVLFILSCNIYSYQLLRKALNIDYNLLETIMLNPMKIQDIKKAIIERHKSGGLKYKWRGKPEEEMSKRKENQIIKRIASVSQGNIGTSLYTWLGNIQEVENNTLEFLNIENKSMPNVLNYEQDNILLQVLLHKEISIKNIKKIYQQENIENIQNNLKSLIRMGLIDEIRINNYRLNPFIALEIVKYLRKKELIN